MPANNYTIGNANEMKLISDDFIRLLEVTFIIPINCFVALLGIFANLFNVIILLRLDFKQNMSYGTIALSITDLAVSSLQLTSEICYVLHYALEDRMIDFMSVGNVPLGWMRYACLNISGWITSLISTERCFCVVFPFHVKQICNRTIYVTALILIYVLYLSFVIPIIILERFTWQPLSGGDFNSSSVKYIFTVVFDEAIQKLEKIFDSVFVLGLALLSQIFLLMSTIYMVCGLIESSRVRKSHETSQTHKGSRFAHSSLSQKERRLVNVAVRLAVVLLACSIPRYIVVAVFALIPAMQEPENVPLINFLVDVTDIFINCNSVCTFFVYFSVYNNFKIIFLSFFRKDTQKSI